MKRLVIVCIALLTPAISLAAPSAENGKAIFNKWCLACHGAKVDMGAGTRAGLLPGTGALAVKYKGKLPALLEERTDLSAELIRVVVRQGINGMPLTRKTEVSDAELADLVAYLTRAPKK